MGWFDKLRGKYKKPEIDPKTIPEGHRGIAAGSLKPGGQDLSPENLAQWQSVPAGEVKDFVLDGQPLFVHSTNVVMAQYRLGTKQLMVEFQGGSAYLYSSISPQEAISFATAQSKGGWVWDHLRVRRTKNGHKKPFKKIK